jgi:type IV pilus assembly protein PilY1
LAQQGISVYVIDVYTGTDYDSGSTQIAKQMAKYGGGKYYHAANTNQLTGYISEILADISRYNSTFASASLPVDATNRSQDKNQVLIPMFRPDSSARPLWMGNLKKYQLVRDGADVMMVGPTPPGTPAVSVIDSISGFISSCRSSFWTSDSGLGTVPNPTTNIPGYWSNVSESPSPKSDCTQSIYDKYSDAPDGPTVEKGGVAEVIRKGNNPTTTNSAPTWAVNRHIYTQPLSGGALSVFSTSSSGLSAATGLSGTPLANMVNFIQGQDVNGEYLGRTDLSLTRPSLHGDAIHSRPLPIDYGDKVIVYYGSNDGMFRAVNTDDGSELWAFVAPENYSKLPRLFNNSPQISYPGMSSLITPTPAPKDYFFDGNIGVYQNADNSKIWIYPSMRRGGRMIYAFDVTNANATPPVFKWKVGCADLTNNNCTSGMQGIGQTWSQPQVASSIQGYAHPVVIVGGGYDSCEDANTASPSCSTPTGAGVYVLDADTGALVKWFPTTRSVAADVALIGITSPTTVDHGYVADTGGNIYRIDFDGSSPDQWSIHRVAYTNGSGRKFLFAPTLLNANHGKVFVAIGSGDREHPLASQYPYSNVINRFYVYVDDVTLTATTNLDGSSMLDATTDLGCNATSVLNSPTYKGWYMNLTQYGTGEQTVTSALIVGGLVTFSTNRPIPQDQGSCTTSLGVARGYWVNLFNGSGGQGVSGMCGGTRSSRYAGGGLPPSPVFAIVNIDNVPTPTVFGAPPRQGNPGGGSGDQGGASPIAPQHPVPAINSKRKPIYWKSSNQN